MSFPIPKIVYDPGTGAVTVTPTYANTQKPYMDDLQAIRHDSITNSGIQQSVIERVDAIRHVIFENVPWSDMPMWSAFFTYAIQGGPFDYYPDATLTDHGSWQLADDKFSPTFTAFGLSKFQMNLRSVWTI